MNNRTGYEESLDRTLRKVTAHIPEDLVEKFGRESGITKKDIHPIPKSLSGIVSAVDGSNSMIIEGGSVGVAAIRAVRTTFNGMERYNRSITPITLVTIGPGHRNLDFDDLYYECYGIPPHKGLDNSDPERASAILRDTLEYWVCLQTATTLPAERFFSSMVPCGFPARTMIRCLPGIIKTAQERELLLAAVAKRTRATWGGGHPLLPAMGGLAELFGIARPVVDKDRSTSP